MARVSVQDGPDLFELANDLTVPRALRAPPAALPDPQPGPDLFDGADDAPRRAGGCALTFVPYEPDPGLVRAACAPCGWGTVGAMGERAATALFDAHAAGRSGL